MSVSKKGDTYGTDCCDTPSVRGHYRPIDNRSRFSDVLWSGLLYDVGGGLGSSRYLSDIRCFQLPSSKHKREDIK